ncbi:MAG: hypothetical protein VXY00_05840 [Candidatus Latescibacterota bacterium]|nr:hypothetical protein [Candidatus Latescibacterota bacterium]MEE2628048.1 hypothetical protein [Candidatus Latescibacterota bacterium]MEE2725856.1 hypothetical protein [Candidatus Latescibacterota bacterium]
MPEWHNISETDCVKWLSVADSIDSCNRAFLHYGSGEIYSPPRRERVEERDGLDHFRLDMPAEWPGKYRVRKRIEEKSSVASGRLESRQAYIELEDVTRGLTVRLDAGHITDMRTGSAGALGLKYIATHAINRVAILGTGRVARTLTLACDALFDLDEIRCTSRSAEKRDAFASDMEPRISTRLHMTDSQSECLDEVDALLSAVPTPEPILDVRATEAIDYLVIVGGDSRTRQVENAVLEKRPVLVDLWEQASVSGEFRWAQDMGTAGQIALARGEDGRVLTVGDAAQGDVQIARGCVYLTGIAAQDLCAAAVVYKRWLERDAT